MSGTSKSGGSSRLQIAAILKRAVSRKYSGFTLVELIVVITILAILATVGFLALSGYSQDAKDSAIKANVRSVASAISSESALTGNSPRYYVIHDSWAALTGALVYVDESPVALTGGAWDATGTNYSAGNPDYSKLKLNADKFKVSLRTVPDFLSIASAAYDPVGQLSVGATDYSSSVTSSGRRRSSSWFQVVGINPATKSAIVMGDYPGTALSGSVAGLVKDPSGTWALVDAETTDVPIPEIETSRYPGCDTDDLRIANGQIWSACNVGASNAWTWGVTQADCFGSATDCALTKRNTFGSYFQWGRNNDVAPKGTPTTTKPFANTLAGGVAHSNFITSGTTPFDWKTTPQNDGLWGGSGTTTSVGTFVTQGSPSAMVGPCAAGYHIPTQAEWWFAINALNGSLTNDTAAWQNDTSLASTLKLPPSGQRSSSNAGYYQQGQIWYYWASSSAGTNARYLSFTTTQVFFSNGTYRAQGNSVRCLKD